MAPTILHVEDDEALSMIVGVVFERLGFRGRTITVETVGAAERLLDETALDGGRFDLIISDMHLPDGLGLDLVRSVRASPIWQHTPMLILSSDVDPKKVGRAYALGANAYVDKSPPGRTFDAVVSALYEHWTKDVVLVPPVPSDPLRQALDRAIAIRTRYAHMYQRLAMLFANRRSESAFWLSRALGESNLQNVLRFLRNHIDDRPLPEDAIEEIATMQHETELQLAAMERRIDGTTSRDTIYREVLDLLSIINYERLSASISQLFPVTSVAVGALRDFFLSTVNDVTAWIALHTTAPALRQRAELLHDAAAISLITVFPEARAPAPAPA